VHARVQPWPPLPGPKMSGNCREWSAPTHSSRQTGLTASLKRSTKTTQYQPHRLRRTRGRSQISPYVNPLLRAISTHPPQHWRRHALERGHRGDRLSEEELDRARERDAPEPAGLRALGLVRRQYPVVARLRAERARLLDEQHGVARLREEEQLRARRQRFCVSARAAGCTMRNQCAPNTMRLNPAGVRVRTRRATHAGGADRTASASRVLARCTRSRRSRMAGPLRTGQQHAKGYCHKGQSKSASTTRTSCTMALVERPCGARGACIVAAERPRPTSSPQALYVCRRTRCPCHRYGHSLSPCA
jgi:hypothetical protein